MSRNLVIPKDDRQTQEEIDDEEEERTPKPKQEKAKEDQTKIVEVPINLELINNKLNYIISIIEGSK